MRQKDGDGHPCDAAGSWHPCGRPWRHTPIVCPTSAVDRRITAFYSRPTSTVEWMKIGKMSDSTERRLESAMLDITLQAGILARGGTSVNALTRLEPTFFFCSERAKTFRSVRRDFNFRYIMSSMSDRCVSCRREGFDFLQVVEDPCLSILIEDLFCSWTIANAQVLNPLF